MYIYLVPFTLPVLQRVELTKILSKIGFAELRLVLFQSRWVYINGIFTTRSRTSVAFRKEHKLSFSRTNTDFFDFPKEIWHGRMLEIGSLLFIVRLSMEQRHTRYLQKMYWEKRISFQKKKPPINNDALCKNKT